MLLCIFTELSPPIPHFLYFPYSIIVCFSWKALVERGKKREWISLPILTHTKNDFKSIFYTPLNKPLHETHTSANSSINKTSPSTLLRKLYTLTEAYTLLCEEKDLQTCNVMSPLHPISTDKYIIPPTSESDL